MPVHTVQWCVQHIPRLPSLGLWQECKGFGAKHLEWLLLMCATIPPRKSAVSERQFSRPLQGLPLSCAQRCCVSWHLPCWRSRHPEGRCSCVSYGLGPPCVGYKVWCVSWNCSSFLQISNRCRKVNSINKHIPIVPHCMQTFTCCMRTWTFLRGLVPHNCVTAAFGHIAR